MNDKKDPHFFQVKATRNAPGQFFGRIGRVPLSYRNKKHVGKIPVEFPIENGFVKIWLHWSQIEEV